MAMEVLPLQTIALRNYAFKGVFVFKGGGERRETEAHHD
jgi:hypothetical protein